MVVRVGIVGAGKMGISHLSIVNAQRDRVPSSPCGDTSSYVLSVLRKYIGVGDPSTAYEDMIDRGALDAVTSSRPRPRRTSRARSRALEKGLHVFVEKPLTLSPRRAGSSPTSPQREKRVNQVGLPQPLRRDLPGGAADPPRAAVSGT
jgi:predicted dehydrogenase